ncbi:MAG: PEGA domain-containing protein [Planctomycetota bacterium]
MKRFAAVCVCALPMAGCLERTITVTSEPPGAIVTLNEVEIGRTPVTTEFRYFGVYDVRVRKDGYEPLVTTREASPPIWEYPPIDLLAMAAPWRVKTSIEWGFELEAEVEPGSAEALQAEQELLDRATDLRDATRGG